MTFSDSPLTKSDSPSDFWGRRWNKLTGPALRRGVYQPIRKCWKWNTHLAALATFVVSGLLHEYVLCLLSQRRRGFQANEDPDVALMRAQSLLNEDDNSTVEYLPNHGSHFLFFAWCAVTLLGERFLAQHVTRFLPPKGSFRTFLVLLTTLPIVHLFTDEFVACSFYDDISLGFPKIILGITTQPTRGR